jgi:hypothetical protein
VVGLDVESTNKLLANMKEKIVKEVENLSTPFALLLLL